MINGVARTVGSEANCWESAPLGESGETLTLAMPEAKPVSQLRLTFDTDLSGEIMPSLTKIVRERQVKGLPLSLVKDYRLQLLRNGSVVWEKEVQNNGQRLNVHDLESVLCDTLQITVTATHGCNRARIYETRIY